MNLKAPAKINLYLDILGRRADGYHELKTLFQTVSLYDELSLRARPAPSASIHLDVDMSALHSGSKKVCPGDRTNIVWRAAELYLEKFPAKKSLHFTLKKQIPVQAGLGGGSSDAAAALLALSQKRQTPNQLTTIAAKLGADVPFFLNKGCAVASGIGEKLAPIRPIPRFWAVIVKPKIGLSTKEVYGWLDSASTRKKAPSGSLTNTPNLNKIINLIRKGKSMKEWSPCLFNRFEEVVFEKVSELRAIKSRLLDSGAHNALLSGSGSALFGLATSRQEALNIKTKFNTRRGEGVWVVHSL